MQIYISYLSFALSNKMLERYSNEHFNEYYVNCNEVNLLKYGLNFTSLKIKVFIFSDTSLGLAYK